MPGDRAREVARSTRETARDGREWASRQARGTVRNGRSLAGSFALDEILPNGIASFIQELLMLIPYALGRGSPKKQVYASITLIILAIVATPFTLGYSLILAGIPALTLLIGLWRLVPAANDTYQEIRGNRLRDRDVPLWKRD
jgi:hypothetical protein